MKKALSNTEKETRGFIIEISPDDWKVTDAVPVRICQQPAQIIPLSLPYSRHAPRFDVWQLNESFYSYNHPLI
jgi:hypothetical protein